MIWVRHFRVSTIQQGESGLGLAAQKDVVMRYMGNIAPIAEFTEVESGKRHKNSPPLLAVLDLCKKKKARLVIAKLDRLSRNVAFISSLMESGIDFVCCDNPHATPLMLHMLADSAEHERKQISERIKAVLGSAEADLAIAGYRVSQAGNIYTKLGGPKLEEARAKAAALKRALQPSEMTVELVAQLRSNGYLLRGIASYLNSLDIRTPLGARWYASTINRVLKRSGALTQERDDARSHSDIPDRVTWCRPDITHAPTVSSLNGSKSQAMPVAISSSAGREPISIGQEPMYDIQEAYRGIDTLASVGAMHFDVTFIDIDGEKCGFRAQQTARQIRNSIPHLLPGLTERQQNIIVRSTSDKVTFIQLDYLDYDQLKSLAPVSCLILQTSPRNHQAGVAISDVMAMKRTSLEGSARVQAQTRPLPVRLDYRAAVISNVNTSRISRP
jgi:DNA invertase Pin-like site-specific DNA recombinase